MRERTYVAVINTAPRGEEWPSTNGHGQTAMEKDLPPGTLVLVYTENGRLPRLPTVECKAHDGTRNRGWFVSKRNFNILGEL